MIKEFELREHELERIMRYAFRDSVTKKATEKNIKVIWECPDFISKATVSFTDKINDCIPCELNDTYEEELDCLFKENTAIAVGIAEDASDILFNKVEENKILFVEPFSNIRNGVCELHLELGFKSKSFKDTESFLKHIENNINID